MLEGEIAPGFARSETEYRTNGMRGGVARRYRQALLSLPRQI